MKSISTFILLLSGISIGIKAQMPVTLTEDSLAIGKVNIPAISVTIPEVNYENTLKVWVKELESGTKSKVVTENNEMTIFGAKVKDLSPNPVNVYSKMIKRDSVIQLKVAFELKKDQYVDRSGTPAEFSKAENYLKQFAKSQYIELVKGQVDSEDKKLRDIEKELSSLEKEKTKMQKSIQSNNTDITNEKENITVQNNEMTTVSAAIIEHNKQLDTMRTGPDKEEKIKYIKELEKKKKKAQSSIESSENKINKLNNDTDKTNGEIPRNEKMQEQVNEKIQAQQAVLGKYTDKLKKIKSY
jgi:peptidoglycan hydrolase CwlO-like protein